MIGFSIFSRAAGVEVGRLCVRVAAICLLKFVIVGGDGCGWLFLVEFNDGFS